MPQLYMFALMPPGDVANAIDKERKLFAGKYKCVKALKPPVHITLYPPFEYIADIKTNMAALHQWASTQTGFSLTARNFGFFKNKINPVVFIDVMKNPSLSRLHLNFVGQLEKYMPVIKGKTYTPHFTIGYRDVPPELMPTIERDYSRRTFTASFDVKSFFLWQHDGKNWQIHDEYFIGADNTLF